MPGSAKMTVSASEQLINTILKIVDYSVEEETTVGPFEGPLGKSWIKLDLSVKLSDFRLSIAGGEGSGTATVEPKATVTYKIPGKDEETKSVAVSLEPPAIGVVPQPNGAKAEIVLRVKSLKFDLPTPPWLPDVLKLLWEELLKGLNDAVAVLIKQINEELANHPIEVADLSDGFEIPLGDDKGLPTTVVFDELKFVKSDLFAAATMTAQ